MKRRLLVAAVLSAGVQSAADPSAAKDVIGAISPINIQEARARAEPLQDWNLVCIAINAGLAERLQHAWDVGGAEMRAPVHRLARGDEVVLADALDLGGPRMTGARLARVTGATTGATGPMFVLAPEDGARVLLDPADMLAWLPDRTLGLPVLVSRDAVQHAANLDARPHIPLQKVGCTSDEEEEELAIGGGGVLLIPAAGAVVDRGGGRGGPPAALRPPAAVRDGGAPPRRSGIAGPPNNRPSKPVVVPEIDASAGWLALAGVLAALLLAWERRRRPA